MEDYKVLNYWDILLSCAFNDATRCGHGAREHMLVCVVAGELELNDNGAITTVRKGESVFLRKDNRLIMTKNPKDGEFYKAIYLVFKRDFLRRYYHSLNKKNLPTYLKRSDLNVYKMPEHPDFTSLFISISPYFDASIQPTEEWANLKLQEGVMALLRTDERFFPCLFDFSEPWKIDILDYLNRNYMYDLSLAEIASFTGRSLASFKRDFRKISHLPPEKWLIRRRLEAAHTLLTEQGAKASDVYLEVGFKNLSHFSKVYKQTFGHSPTSISLQTN